MIYFRKASCLHYEKQACEIFKYRKHPAKSVGREIDVNIVAMIWIRKYAKIWRLLPPIH
jgi:hypothetical protein